MNHLPLMHALLPLLPLQPLLQSRRARDCIALRLDTVDLPLNRAYPETSSAAAAAAAAVPNEPQDGTIRSAGDSCNPSAISPACIAAMKRLLIGRRVYFVPVEADVGFVRANIKFRNGFFFKKDFGCILSIAGTGNDERGQFFVSSPSSWSFVPNSLLEVAYTPQAGGLYRRS